MKRSEMLKSMEESWNQQNQQEKEKSKELIEEILDEYRGSIRSVLEQEAKSTKSFIRKYRMILIGLCLITVIIFLVLGVLFMRAEFEIYRNGRLMDERKELVEKRDRAMESWNKISAFDQVQIMEYENGAIFIVSEAKEAKGYELKDGRSVLQIKKGRGE